MCANGLKFFSFYSLLLRYGFYTAVNSEEQIRMKGAVLFKAAIGDSKEERELIIHLPKKYIKTPLEVPSNLCIGWFHEDGQTADKIETLSDEKLSQVIVVGIPNMKWKSRSWYDSAFMPSGCRESRKQRMVMPTSFWNFLRKEAMSLYRHATELPGYNMFSGKSKRGGYIGLVFVADKT